MVAKVLHLLGSEVISSQFGVVNLEEDVGIADGGGHDLNWSAFGELVGCVRQQLFFT